MSFFAKIISLRNIQPDSYELILFEEAKGKTHKVHFLLTDNQFDFQHTFYDVLIIGGQLFVENTPTSSWINIRLEVRYPKISIDIEALNPSVLVNASAYIYLYPNAF